jgi:hypothetical protein
VTKLEKLAAEIAIIPPIRKNEAATSAYIPWEVIEALRAELAASGFDWRAGHKRYKANLAGQRA